MIAFLDGSLAQSFPTHVTVEVAGVGYEVLIPLSSYDRLPVVGQRIHLLTHLQVREDAHVLFGFMTDGERDLFRLLLNNVSGVGPKLALAILSGMSVANFKAAVVAGDTAAISKLKGLGKKTAERVVLELRDKVGVAAAWEVASAGHAPSPAEASINDAVLALISLGYKQVEAHKAVRQVRDAQPGGDLAVDELVRRALKVLA
jgi:Holliday junction DNA helicase RuvA